MEKRRGKLIVFEGIDGTGKSTQVRLLREYLEPQGIRVVTDYEPTRGEWGMRVRAAAASGKRLPVEEEVDCLLRDRRDHVEQLITPALERGCWVLLDRYYPPMLAYQGATGIDPIELQRLNESFAPQPDAAFWLDIPVEVALGRIRNRGETNDAFEQRHFLEACRRIYAALKAPWWRQIDATADALNVHTRVLEYVKVLLGELS